MKYFDQTDAWTEDALIGGTHFPVVVQNIKVAADAEILRGELLCASVSGGTYAPVSTAADAQKVLCIAADDFTADSLHTATNAYFAGVFNKAPVTKNWTANTATIFDDLKDASETIQENSGVIPTLMIIGKNVEKYLLKNKDLREFLFSANPAATAFYNFQPRYDSPQARRIGFIPQLNLEVYSYFVTYTDETGQVKPFVDDDAVILGVPGRGKFLFGALRLLDQSGNWQTYSAEDIPVYNFNYEAQSTSLTVYSCCLPVPDVIDDWVCLNVGN